MRARIAATVVMAASILVGTAGCNLIAPQATQLKYDPSDGVGGQVGDVAVRNAMLITDDDGATANLVVSFVNTGEKSRRVSVQWKAEGDKVTDSVTVPGNASTTVGANDGPVVTLRNIDAKPGALFPVFFQYGNETGTDLLVPVLDNQLQAYSTLTPTPTPEPTVVPAPATTATPEPGQTPEPTDTPAPTETPAP